jgi:hypothetical protein
LFLADFDTLRKIVPSIRSDIALARIPSGIRTIEARNNPSSQYCSGTIHFGSDVKAVDAAGSASLAVDTDRC